MHSDNVISLPHRTGGYSHEVANLILGIPGRYEIFGHNMRVRGVLVQYRDSRRREMKLQFVPFEIYDTKKGEAWYSRKDDAEKIRVSHVFLLGLGALCVPDHAKVSEDGKQSMEDIRTVVQAAMTLYALKAFRESTTSACGRVGEREQ